MMGKALIGLRAFSARAKKEPRLSNAKKAEEQKKLN